MNNNKRAQEVWNLIRDLSLGDVTAVNLIEKELNKAVQEEREGIVEGLINKFKFKSSFKMNIITYFYMVVKPKDTFIGLTTSVVNNSIRLIRERSYK